MLKKFFLCLQVSVKLYIIIVVTFINEFKWKEWIQKLKQNVEEEGIDII